MGLYRDTRHYVWRYRIYRFMSEDIGLYRSIEVYVGIEVCVHIYVYIGLLAPC